MYIEWNLEPVGKEQISEVRPAQEGGIHLTTPEDFDFTLSKDLVEEIVRISNQFKDQ